MRARSAGVSRVGLPSSSSTTSRGWIPARSAGPLRTTPRISTPAAGSSESVFAISALTSCGSMPSQPRVTSPSLMICSSTVLREARPGIAKPMPSEPPDCEKIVLLMPIRLPAMSTSAPPGVAGIDRGVGLDEILEPVDAEVIAAERADDAERHRVAEAERIPDRENEVADLHAVERAERDDGNFSPSAFRTARSDSGSVPRTRRVHSPAVGEKQLDVVGPLDHVIVRDHVAFGRDDDARAETRGALPRQPLGELGEVAAHQRVLGERTAPHFLARVDVDDGRHRLLCRVGDARDPRQDDRRRGFLEQHERARRPCR
jgi:hypothetical protein